MAPLLCRLVLCMWPTPTQESPNGEVTEEGLN